MLFLSSILLRLSWNTRNIFEDLGPLRDSIHDVIISDDVDIGCMIIRLTMIDSVSDQLVGLREFVSTH